MADDPTKTAADRKLVAVMQEHEIDYLTKKHGVTREQVRAAVAEVGNSREKVEAVLSRQQAQP